MANAKTPTLILFDIDGTLYHGDRSGRAAFNDTAIELLGNTYRDHDLDFAGRLDTWIFEQLMQFNGIEVTADLTRQFKEAAPANLKRRIESGDFNIQRCVGALELVTRLLEIKDDHHLTLGLLTGNWPINGMIKVSSVGFRPEWFEVNAWGDDGPTRNDLPPVALQRFHEQCHCNNSKITFENVIIIGDTPHDVACAKANGCRSLAVATGWSTLEELQATDPDWAIQDLSDLTAVVDWILATQSSIAPTT